MFHSVFLRTRAVQVPGQTKSKLKKKASALIAIGIVVLFLGEWITAQENQVNEADLVHFGDLVDVDVIGGFEFDWRGKLSPEGFLDGLNGYGDPIFGLCRSESEIAIDVTKAYSKLLRDPKVVVRILDRSNRAVVTVDGAVKLPQRFQLRRPAELRELLVLSGGITDEASGEIQIFRPRDLNCSERMSRNDSKPPVGQVVLKVNGSHITNIKISDILKGEPSANPVIQSGDLITVLRAVPIYVIGGVNNPRQISAREGMTLSRAIASAGGLAKEADGGAVTIFRRELNDMKRIEADLGKIAADSAPDPELKAFDIVDVAQKGRDKRKYAPVISGGNVGSKTSLPLRIVE
jgi:polysaccharide export outer membrane protein